MKILIGSDISTRYNRELVDAAYCKKIYREMKPLLDGADYRIVNLENVLREEGVGEPIIKSGPNLYGLPKNISLLTEGGFDAVTLANNHFGDFGPEGIDSTLKLLDENQIARFGGGRNKEEAYMAHYVEKDELKIAFLSVCENEFGTATDSAPGSAGYELKLLRDRMQEEKKKAEFVVVIFHGGNEHNPLPAPMTQDRYRLIIDLGADAVVAMHTHCIQGYETYEGKPIIYSMGNFYFPDREEKAGFWFCGYMTELHIEKGKNITFRVHPYRLVEDGALLHRYYGEDKEKMLSYIKKLSDIILDRKELDRYFEGWCTMAGPGYSRHYASYDPSFEDDSPDAETRQKIAHLRNNLTCEAHNYMTRRFLMLELEGRLPEAKKTAEELKKLQQMPV